MWYSRSARLLGAALAVLLGGCAQRTPETAESQMAPEAYGFALDSAIGAGERAAIDRLPAGAGRDLVLGTCLICHGASLITVQRKDSAAWARSVAQMVAWGSPLTPAQQPALVGYLTEHYGPRAAEGTRRPRESELPPRARAPLAAAESVYQELRYLKDQIDVTRYRGADRSTRGVPVSELRTRYEVVRSSLLMGLASVADTVLAGEDRRALAVMRRTLETELVALGISGDTAGAPAVQCDYEAARLAEGPTGLEVLTDRMYACFGRAAQNIRYEGEVLDRLTVLGLLPRTEDPERRRRLFLALAPVWQSVNGDGGPASPYRHLVRLSARRWNAGRSPTEASVRQLGIDPQVMEEWLTAILERWRDITPEEMLEPWDFHYAMGGASRFLGPRLSRSGLLSLNQRYYAALGASPESLGIQYDLDPRPGKTPVAFTTFGARARQERGAWVGAVPWVFATYRVGGLDNLSELLHETGHAIHIAAIRTRPAFLDWPDSDPFSEALGDIVGLEVYEPAWQARYMGDSVAPADAVHAKYAGIVLDIAWALFEIRLHAHPEWDPNQVWTQITRDYLRIVPHPELSWWAMRGQLVNAPGYMMNYAVGAIIVAELRARAQELHGPFTLGDPSWYRWIAARLYRFGLERSSREVITDFLGRPLSPRALLDDMARAGPAGSGP